MLRRVVWGSANSFGLGQRVAEMAGHYNYWGLHRVGCRQERWRVAIEGEDYKFITVIAVLVLSSSCIKDSVHSQITSRNCLVYLEVFYIIVHLVSIYRL